MDQGCNYLIVEFGEGNKRGGGALQYRCMSVTKFPLSNLLKVTF